MRCAACGHVNRRDSRHCTECGARLRAVCPACGAPREAVEKFCGDCGASLSAGPAIGPQVANAVPPEIPRSLAAGRYRVERFLGEGAKKRVYLAHDTRLDREVAIAVIKTEGLDDAGRTRIHREAQAMGRLGDHPNIVTVYDVGDDRGQLYIVSQYMPGGDVGRLLGEAGSRQLPIEDSLRVAEHICLALAHAHSKGIVHRDLKPGNVWLAEDGTPKLGDFGLAVALDRSRLTQEGMMVGTAAYMPPEQALGHPPDARSDLYALGAMLYEMATGRPPFLGDDAVAVISQHINTPPVAPSWHNPAVGKTFEALILQLLAKDPEARPRSAGEVRERLRAITTAPAIVAAQAASAVANPLDRLAAGVFVGREQETRKLRDAFDQVLSGDGRVVMVVGEPGIGKTRTAEELTTYARLRGAQVLWGRCYEGEGAPPYWPWVQIVRAYVHERDPKELLSDLGAGAADIAEVVSEVRERLPGLPPVAKLEPEQARFQLFDSITAFLKNASKRQALVLVLDDLHWSDTPSLLLLQFLASELAGSRLFVLGTYRDVELRRQHPLSETLAALAREHHGERILLRGLGESDVARFIEMSAGLAPPPALVAAVYRETEGNPFFIHEVVRLLVHDGRLQSPEPNTGWSVEIPQGIREVIGRRLNQVSAEANKALTVASVLGREFDLTVLSRVVDLDEERLLQGIDEALAARLVEEIPDSPGRHRFTHALVRETLYEELSTTRRVRLHRRIAEVLEVHYGSRSERHLAELAHHFAEGAHGGGDVDKAVAYATRAGDQAATVLAYEDAGAHYERALQALDLKQTPAELARCDLLIALGNSQRWALDPVRARKPLLEAADVARAQGDPVRLARAAWSAGYGFREPLHKPNDSCIMRCS
jgi:hypothetical protein